MIFLLALMAVVTIATSIVLGWSMATGGLAIGWFILVTIFVVATRGRPANRFFRTVGAATLGGALVTVLAPLVAFALDNPLVSIDVANSCNVPFVVDEVQLNVAQGESQTVRAPGVPVDVLVAGNQITVQSGLGYERTISTSTVYTIIFDGQQIVDGEPVTVDLGAQPVHRVEVACG